MSQDNLNRRDFAKQLACTTGLACYGLHGAATSEAVEFQTDEKSPPPPELPETPDPLQIQAELLEQVLLHRYPGDRLTPEKLEQIRGKIASNLHRSRILGSQALDNADQPAFVFGPYRGPSSAE